MMVKGGSSCRKPSGGARAQAVTKRSSAARSASLKASMTCQKKPMQRSKLL